MHTAARLNFIQKLLRRLLHEHINMLGRYEFSLPDEVARGQLRPLRGLETLDDFLAQLP
ncbi:hypothetical protein ACFFLM_26340 [Deinococcus oregonensis]|uniref:Uncharacterized protein n=1 Tax=Deinococcus oregonensis TaxID=1805970 RepID=A0ABV6B6S6_9DEIO